MKRTVFALISCVMLLPVGAVEAQTQASSQSEAQSAPAASQLPEQDRAFLQAASMGSATEIDASKLAEKTSRDKDVKAFAHRMRVDHTKMLLQLKQGAPRYAEVPKDNADQGLLDSLKPLKGKEFDEAFIAKVGLKGHEDAIAAFKKEISDGQNHSLKKLAKNALPTIEHHYKLAQNLAHKKGGQP